MTEQATQQHLSDEQLVRLAYLDCTAQEQESWQAHVSDCPTCRAEFSQMESARQILCGSSIPVPPQSKLSASQILSGSSGPVRKAPAPPAATGAQGSIGQQALIVAALLFVAVVGFMAGDWYRARQIERTVAELVDMRMAENGDRMQQVVDGNNAALQNQWRNEMDQQMQTRLAEPAPGSGERSEIWTAIRQLESNQLVLKSWLDELAQRIWLSRQVTEFERSNTKDTRNILPVNLKP